MRTLATLTLIFFTTAASAAELPPSAEALVPPTWAGERLEGVVEDLPAAAWAEAIGGAPLRGLLGLVGENGDVLGAEAQVQQANGRATQAASNWLPSLQGSGSWQTGTPSAAFGSDVGNSIDQLSASLDLNVPLTPWTAIPSQQSARSDRQAAEFQLNDTRADVAVALTSSWLDRSQARAALALVQQQLATQEQLLAVTEARYAAGDATGVEVLQQRQQVASTRANLPTADAEVQRSDRALAALLRLRTDSLPAAPTALPEPPHVALPAPIDLVLADPSIDAVRAQWQAAQARTRTGTARLAPNLAFTASTGVRYTEGVESVARPTWSAGLGLTVPIFDGAATVGGIQEARGAERQALIQLEDTVLDLIVAVEDARTRWDETSERRSAADNAESLADDALTAALATYAAGTATYNTVLTAGQASFAASQTALQAHRDQLDAAVGLFSVTRAGWASGSR